MSDSVYQARADVTLIIISRQNMIASGRFKMNSTIKPWSSIFDVGAILSPIFATSLLLSLVIYLFFFTLVPSIISVRKRQIKNLGPETNGQADASTPASLTTNDNDFGDLAGFSYVVMTSLFGVVLGMLANLLGGFVVIDAGAPDKLIGAIGAVLAVSLGVVGTLFTDTGRIGLRKPIGAIAFLTSFLVSGFYWKLLQTSGG
jgi:hypothetical protein